MREILKRAKEDPQFRKKMIRKLGSSSFRGSLEVMVTSETRTDRGKEFKGVLSIFTDLPDRPGLRQKFEVFAEDRGEDYKIIDQSSQKLGRFEIALLEYYFNWDYISR